MRGSDGHATLSDAHLRLIGESAIRDEIARARGYFTATNRGELEQLGYRRAQVRIPALVLPVWDVHGNIANYQIRPDEPRVIRGKRIKYETRKGSRMVVDVPPPARDQIGDPSVDLWITEGIRKADAAVSVGLCCIDLLGVWNWRGSTKGGGKVVLPDWESIALNDRKVIVCFDSDVRTKPEVRAALDRFHRFLESRGANVHECCLPDLGEGKTGLDDYLAAGHSKEDLESLVGEFDQASLGAGGRPMIVTTGRQVIELLDESLEAIDAANDPPRLFLRDGDIVRVCLDECGSPQIKRLDDRALLYHLTDSADFFGLSQERGLYAVPPPRNVIQAIQGKPDVIYLPLVGTCETPILHADGSLHAEEGYDSESGLYLVRRAGFEMEDVPDTPGDHDVQQASDLLWGVFDDFPFVSNADRVMVVGFVLTIVHRALISGPVPMLIVDARQAGTGKTLVSRVMHIIGTGRDASLMVAPEDDAAWRKAITSFLDASAQVVIVDNVDGSLWAPSLAALLTSDRWSDRILGKSEMVYLPNRSVMIANGNNLKLRGDLPRRCCWARLDAQHERPWQREGFKRPDLVGWVADNRGQLVRAALIIGRAWLQAGRPAPMATVPAMGGFESWRHTIGGMLGAAGFTEFLQNAEEMYELADDETPQWAEFLAGLLDWKASGRWTVRELAIALRHPDLAELLPDSIEAVIDSNRKVGRALAAREGRRFPTDSGDVVWLAKDGKQQRAQVWRVLRDVRGVSK